MRTKFILCFLKEQPEMGSMSLEFHHRDLQAAKTSHEKKLIQRQTNTTDKQIDQLAYELYGLTDEEIHIVEEATRE